MKDTLLALMWITGGKMKKDTSYPVANSTYSYHSSGILRGIIFPTEIEEMDR